MTLISVKDIVPGNIISFNPVGNYVYAVVAIEKTSTKLIKCWSFLMTQKYRKMKDEEKHLIMYVWHEDQKTNRL
jgi:hypothetical protein